MDKKQFKDVNIQQQVEEMERLLNESKVEDAQKYYLAGIMAGMRFQKDVQQSA